ncbi:MAG: hypothetical protein KJP02_10395 [Octadecabacter sp.]|nr:hypothetical protein [Octadecabacter sp.]
MKRALAAALRVLPFATTGGMVAAFLAYSPFAAPLVERSSAQIEAQITRAMASEVTLAWLLPRVQDAILAENLIQLELLQGLADDHGIVLPAPMLDDIAALEAAASGFLARASACGVCAVDITQCASLSQIGSCALPFEMTPAGDLNALRRAGVAYAAGNAVDSWDVGLALVGLGATGAMIASGGASGTVKVGTTLLRSARRIGSLTPAFTRTLGDMLRIPVEWGRLPAYIAGRAPLEEVTDVVKLAQLQAVAADLGRVRRNTSTAEALVLMRFVDSPTDAARLARVSDGLGPKTPGALEVLGKSRVFRATLRLGDLALGAALAIYAFGLHIALAGAQLFGNLCLRGLRRSVLR